MTTTQSAATLAEHLKGKGWFMSVGIDRDSLSSPPVLRVVTKNKKSPGHEEIPEKWDGLEVRTVKWEPSISKIESRPDYVPGERSERPDPPPPPPYRHQNVDDTNFVKLSSGGRIIPARFVQRRA